MLLFQAGPESKGNKSFFLAKGRAGWAATGDEGWAIPWAPKRCILVFKFSPRLKLCRHEPFWRASINMNLVCALPWLQPPRLPPPDVLHGADS